METSAWMRATMPVVSASSESKLETSVRLELAVEFGFGFEFELELEFGFGFGVDVREGSMVVVVVERVEKTGFPAEVRTKYWREGYTSTTRGAIGA
jgi:hypothetical protein